VVCYFHLLTTWRHAHQFDVQTTNVKDKMKKLRMIQDEDLCDMFKPFHLLSQKGLCIRGCLKWLAHWLIIWHPLVKIDKLPMLVGAKNVHICKILLV